MIGVLVALLLTLQASSDLVQADDVVLRADRLAMARCTTTLPLETVDIHTSVICMVNGDGRPQNCQADDVTLTAPQRRAALCMAAQAWIEGRNGLEVKGRSVAIPIRYRFVTETGPADAAPSSR